MNKFKFDKVDESFREPGKHARILIQSPNLELTSYFQFGSGTSFIANEKTAFSSATQISRLNNELPVPTAHN